MSEYIAIKKSTAEATVRALLNASFRSVTVSEANAIINEITSPEASKTFENLYEALRRSKMECDELRETLKVMESEIESFKEWAETEEGLKNGTAED